MYCPEICSPHIKGKRFQEPQHLGQGLRVWFSYLYSSYLLLLAVSLQWKGGKSRSHTPHTTLLGLTVLNYQNAGCHTKHEDKAMRLMSWQERLHLSPTKNMALKGSHLGRLKIYCSNSAMVQTYFWKSFLAVKSLLPVHLNSLIMGHLRP